MFYVNKMVIGKNCLIMVYVYVVYDCIFGDYVILVNNVVLVGYVEIEDWVILEVLVVVQQFICIGQYSFIVGGLLVCKSVLFYICVVCELFSYVGVNNVGLICCNFIIEQINWIYDIYCIMFVKGYNFFNVLEIVELLMEFSVEKDNILQFVWFIECGIFRGFNQFNGSEFYEDQVYWSCKMLLVGMDIV